MNHRSMVGYPVLDACVLEQDNEPLFAHCVSTLQAALDKSLMYKSKCDVTVPVNISHRHNKYQPVKHYTYIM